MTKRVYRFFVLGAAMLSLWAVTLLAPAPQAFAKAYTYASIGARIRCTCNEAIYLVDMDGSMRWIPDPTTYNNLFRDWNGVDNVDAIDSGAVGTPLTSGAYLAQSPDAPQVYLITNGVKRWITSPAAMDQFYFS